MKKTKEIIKKEDKKDKEFLKKIGLRIKERKWYLLCILMAWIILTIYINPDYYENSKYTISDPYNNSELRLTEEFKQDEERKFTIKSELNNLEQISIFCGTFGNYSESILNVKITEKETGKMIFDKDVSTSEIATQEYLDIPIEKQKDSKGKEYEITLKCVKKNSNTLFLWEREVINSNGEILRTQLFEKVFFYPQVMILYGIILISVLIVMLILALVIEPKLDEKTFVLFAIVVGLCFLILSPFPHTVAEYSHYFRSYMIASGKPFNDINEFGKIGGYVAENYEDSSAEINEVSLKTLLINDQLANFKYSDEKDFHENFYLSSAIPIDHSIASIGILIAKLFNLNIVGYIVLARGMTLAFYIVISYFALKNMKYYKSTMFMVLTMPVGLWMAGTVNIDPILHGAAFLFVSICLKYFFEDNVQNKVTTLDKILIIITAIMVISTKYLVYVPLLLLFFLIPKEKFKNKDEYIAIIILAIAIGIVIIMWQFWMLGEYKYTEDRTGGHTGIEGQISFVLDNFLYFIRIYIQSFETVWNASVELTSFFSPIVLPSFFTLASILEKDKYEFVGKKRRALYLMIIVFIMIIALMFLAEYLAWNPIGNDSIAGYQARYILPILILWGIFIGEFMKVENKINNYEQKLILIILITNLNMIFGNITMMFE